MFKKFQTERTQLRPIKENDSEFAFENWTQELDIAMFMTWKPHKKIHETDLFISSCIDGWENNNYTWVIETRDSKEIIGSFSARKDEHKVDIGYLLLKEYWGNGYMSEVIRAFIKEAFKLKNIKRIYAVCDKDNIASKRVMEKSGMTYEGLLKSWLVHPNMSKEPRDCHCLAIVKKQ